MKLQYSYMPKVYNHGISIWHLLINVLVTIMVIVAVTAEDVLEATRLMKVATQTAATDPRTGALILLKCLLFGYSLCAGRKVLRSMNFWTPSFLWSNSSFLFLTLCYFILWVYTAYRDSRHGHGHVVFLLIGYDVGIFFIPIAAKRNRLISCITVQWRCVVSESKLKSLVLNGDAGII